MTLKVVQREQGMYLVDIIYDGQVKQVKKNSKLIVWQNNITAAFDQDQRQMKVENSLHYCRLQERAEKLRAIK